MTDHYRVTLEDVLIAHEASLTFGGGVPGIKSEDALLSAIGRPYQVFTGLEPYPTVDAKAACLLHSLATCHGFTDANKRTAWMVANTFLIQELCLLEPPEEPHWYDTMAIMVEERWTVEQVEQWLAPHIQHFETIEDLEAALGPWWENPFDSE